VLMNFKPKELWLGANPRTLQLDRLLREARQQNVVVVKHEEGDTFDFGGMRVRVLSPWRDWRVSAGPQNDDSLVLHLTYGRTSALLEGDAGRKIERRIAVEKPQATLLKVGHHGSSTATTAEFMAAVQPRFAVISVGTFNPYRLPRSEVLDRLGDAGVSTYRTDLNGAVSFYLDGETVRPQTPTLH